MHTIEISTHEIARRLDVATGGVAAATAAVGVMAREVGEAEKKAAEKVCYNVTKGFFSLIQSQLTQKMVQTKTAALAKIQSLRHFGRSLQRIHQQLETDYQRITQRYASLFNGLADSLQSQVYSLDRPAVEAADTDYAVWNRRVLMAGVPVAAIQQDFLSAATELTVARNKATCRTVVQGAETLVRHGIELSESMNSILRNQRQEGFRSVCVPVLALEASDVFLDGSTQTEFFVNETALPPPLQGRIRKACFESVDRMHWTEADAAERGAVSERVAALVRNSVGNDRLRKMMMSLLEKSSCRKLEAIS